MYIRVKSTPNSPRKSVQIVEGKRDATTGKVKQKIVRHVGIAMDASEEQKLKDLGREIISKLEVERAVEASQDSLFPIESTNIAPVAKRGRPAKKRLSEVLPPDQVSLMDVVEEKRIIEGIHEIGGCVFDDMYSQLCGTKKLSTSQYGRLRDVVLARLANPCSKHKTQDDLLRRFDRSHNLDALYRMMDKVHGHIDLVKQLTFSKTQGLFPNGVDVLLFDVTTLYFESVTTDDLRAYGYSKDHRFNTTQVVLALATNQEGLPVGYELFPGNKAEVGTLVKAVDHWRTLFAIKDVCFVGDRAMMSKENMVLLESRGYHYVIAAKLKGLPKALQQQILDQDHYHPTLLDQSLAWIGEFAYQGQRLVVSYKQRRAEKDAKDRQRILDKLEKQLGQQGSSKKLITNAGVKQYTRVEQSKAFIDQDKIARAKAWDGLHGMITNITDEAPSKLIARYARLWKIEESFRINKHTLKMRPIFHFKPERIQAHIAICYMAFSVLRHMEYQVSLTQKLSVNRIIQTLMSVQASIYRHKRTRDRYRVPSAFSLEANKIYRAFNIQRSTDAEPYLK